MFGWVVMPGSRGFLVGVRGEEITFRGTITWYKVTELYLVAFLLSSLGSDMLANCISKRRTSSISARATSASAPRNVATSTMYSR